MKRKKKKKEKFEKLIRISKNQLMIDISRTAWFQLVTRLQ
jgi:hypothetical protein